MEEVKARLVVTTAALLCMVTACSPGPREDCSATGDIATLCGFANPEDIEYVEGADLVVVSGLRMDGATPRGGLLSAFAPGSREVRTIWPTGGASDFAADPAYGAPSCQGPAEPEGFYPHGITSQAADTEILLYVSAHAGEGGGREAVEIFALEGKANQARLSWKGCVPTPGAVQLNDLALAPDGELVASNYQPDGSLSHTFKASILGSRTGNVVAWARGRGWRTLANTDAQMANGVAVSADGRMVFYSETITGRLYRVPRNGVTPPVHIELDGKADNLSWTDRGTLLMASHDSAMAFMACAFGRRPCRSGWMVYEINPDTLASHLITKHDGEVVGAIATAAQVGQSIYLGSVFDDRVGIIRNWR
ncbi:MAG: hypothetical protein ACE5E4_06520 [Candidatus Binatia bacterium]